MESVLAQLALRADDLAKLRRFVETETVAQACSGETVVEGREHAERIPAQTDRPGQRRRSCRSTWPGNRRCGCRPTAPVPGPAATGWRPASATPRCACAGLGLTVQRIEGSRAWCAARATARPRVRPWPTARALQPQVETVPALLDVAPGSWYVPLDQPLAGLAIAALEPDTPVSYVTQGVIGGGVHACRACWRGRIPPRHRCPDRAKPSSAAASHRPGCRPARRG